MGYELILSVGKANKPFRKSNGEEEKKWFQVMATVDLCKPGYDSEVYKLTTITDKSKEVYLYAPMGNGDTEVETDRYDSALHVISINDMLEALRKDSERDTYRRFKWAIAMLESMKDDSEELECVLFGY